MKQKVILIAMSFILILFMILIIVAWKEKNIIENSNEIKQSEYISTITPELGNDNISENNYSRVMFELGGYGAFYIETEYEDGLVRINGEKESESYMKSGIYLMFESVTSWFPKNRLFDIEIELYKNDGNIGEQITLKNVYVFDGHINEIYDIENIECFIILDDGEDVVFDLSKLKSVNWLGVYTNSVKFNCSDLSAMSNLVHLTAYGGSIQGNIVDLARAKSLECIELYGGDVDINLDDLAQIKSLKQIILSLYQVNITGDLESISNNIEVLRISNINISGNLHSLSDNVKLKDLKIEGSSNVIGNLEDLKSLVNLESLSLINCDEIDGNLESILGMNRLKYLWINSEQISGNISSLKNNADLIYVDLSSNNFSGDISIFAELKKLIVLGLASDSIIGDIGTLGVLNNLKECYTSDCPNITGELIIVNSKEIYGD